MSSPPAQPAAAAASDVPKLLVLLSGSGSNFAALLGATRATPPALAARIVHVVSNRKSAYGLTRAVQAVPPVPSTYHNLLAFGRDRAAYDRALAGLVLAQAPDVVVCAGWMHILSPAFLQPLADAAVDVVNLHPALPGRFDGKDAIRRAWDCFRRGELDPPETGVMVHKVIAEVDRGQPLVVRKVPLREGESLEELEERIHEVEHEAIVEGTRLMLEERAERRKKGERAGEQDAGDDKAEKEAKT